MVLRIVVVGGGVNGIGTALALKQRLPNCQLTVVSKDFTPDTTGDGAAGMWGPYLIEGTPDDKVLQWSQDTWNLFNEWYKSGDSLSWGVSLVPGTVVSQHKLPEEIWSHIPMSYKTLTQEEYSKYGHKYSSGYQFTTLIAEPSRFLPKLMAKVEEYGGTLVKRSLCSLEEVASTADLVMNCSGLGAKDLVPDDLVYPCRGQVMRVHAPWVKEFFADESDDSFCYILPNIDKVVLGGTHQDNDWRREVDPVDSETIWRNCIESMPSLKNCEVVKEWVGLRPCRKGGIRVDTDEIVVKDRHIPVVHNYGHGGCGISTFWGCSKEAASLAVNLIQKYYGSPSKL
ncbi:D-aspartate oxidase [Macrobrachium rosenbergii]|uniref:D-aspartate oxidase n=1 Tax=Macrobrachium rosenbergii TaxID=79674 RepID=UPI0034D63A48